MKKNGSFEQSRHLICLSAVSISGEMEKGSGKTESRWRV